MTELDSVEGRNRNKINGKYENIGLVANEQMGSLAQIIKAQIERKFCAQWRSLTLYAEQFALILRSVALCCALMTFYGGFHGAQILKCLRVQQSANCAGTHFALCCALLRQFCTN